MFIYFLTKDLVFSQKSHIIVSLVFPPKGFSGLYNCWDLAGWGFDALVSKRVFLSKGFSNKGPCLIEGNDYPGHGIYNLPIHRTDGIGVLPDFLKRMERKKWFK